MKRFIKLMSAMLLLGAVVTASSFEGNPEVSVTSNSSNVLNKFTDVSGRRCDPIQRLMGMLCKNSEDILVEQ